MVSDPSLFWWAGATELGLATPLLFNLFLPALWSLNIETELSRHFLLRFQSLLISSPAAFLTQTVCLDDTTVKFEIWDTAGQERYHSLAPMYYRGAQAAIVVYDITNTVRHMTSAAQCHCLAWTLSSRVGWWFLTSETAAELCSLIALPVICNM